MGDFRAGFDRKIGQKLLLLLLVADQIWSILLATFSLKTGHLPTFWPLLFSKVARLKPLRPKGLRVFWPLFHFFSSLKCEKNIKIYIKWRKKWPTGQQGNFGGFPVDICGFGAEVWSNPQSSSFKMDGGVLYWQCDTVSYIY